MVAQRNTQVPPPKYSAVDLFSEAQRDTRVRSPITAEDREKIFDLLKKNATIGNHSVVRDAAVLALGKVGTEEAVDVLLERFKTERFWDVKQDILLALGVSRSPKALDTLSLAIRNRKLTSYALMALGLTGDTERAGDIVLAYFKKNRRKSKTLPDQLSSAAVALGVLRHKGAVDELAKALRSKKTNKVVRAYCAHALGNIGTDKARKALNAVLDKSEQNTQRAAALALGGFDDPSVLKTLAGKDGLGKPDPLVSGFAAISIADALTALPQSEWKKYPDALKKIAMAPQKDPVKAQYANLALAMIGALDNEMRRYFSEELREARRSPDTLSSMAMAAGVGGVTSLESALLEIANSASHPPKTRSYAALSIGMLSTDPTETAKTLQTIYRRSNDPDVKRGAVMGLGIVGDRDDVPFLIAALREDESHPLARYTHGAAAIALGMIRDGDSIPKIESLLGHSNPRIRGYALAALGYLADKDAIPAMPALYARNNFRQEFPTLTIVMHNL